MSQKVKINAGYSDKTSENYNSSQYSLSLELEVSITEQKDIEAATDRLFNLCRVIIQKQKGASVDSLLTSDSSSVSQPSQPQQLTSGTHNTSQLASPAQVKCIFAVAKQTGLQNGAISALANRFNKQNLEELSKQEASLLIRELKGEQ